mgnify:CR=1 FL=1
MVPEEGYYQPEVFPWDGGYELTEELSFMKRKVIPFLLNHPYSGPFRLPVNAKAEGIYPDYFKVGHRDTHSELTHAMLQMFSYASNPFVYLLICSLM